MRKKKKKKANGEKGKRTSNTYKKTHKNHDTPFQT